MGQTVYRPFLIILSAQGDITLPALKSVPPGITLPALKSVPPGIKMEVETEVGHITLLLPNKCTEDGPIFWDRLYIDPY